MPKDLENLERRELIREIEVMRKTLESYNDNTNFKVGFFCGVAAVILILVVGVIWSR